MVKVGRTPELSGVQTLVGLLKSTLRVPARGAPARRRPDRSRIVESLERRDLLSTTTAVQTYCPPQPPDPGTVLEGTTGTGLDQLVAIITTDPGLRRKVPDAEIVSAANAADAMSHIIVEAIWTAGLANDGCINAADVRDLSTYIQANYADQWIMLHGDDEDGLESGFHLVQNDGATTRLFGTNAVNTVADGIFHLGFCIVGDKLLNEDGNPNASVEKVAAWLNELLKDDFTNPALINPAVDPYAEPTTGTGLDRIVEIITTDPGLNRKVPTSQITAAAEAADEMNRIIVEAIWTTGVANDGRVNAADVRDLSAYIRGNYADRWIELHGDDEDGLETGFHLVQNDGATTRLFSANAVNTVADGIFHLGFSIDRDSLLNEDGNRNASVETVAWWLDELLVSDFANPALVNPAVHAYAEPTTGTGLDRLVEIIAADPGLNLKVPTSEITAGAQAADRMNQIILDAIRASGAANDGRIDGADVRDINAWIRRDYSDEWTARHGDDEETAETGFHLVQNDGATTRLFATNAVNTVADGIYHVGFSIVCDRLLNEDGDKNAAVDTVAFWLNELLENDLAGDGLDNPALEPDLDAIASAATFTLPGPIELSGAAGDYREVPHGDAFALDEGTIALRFTADNVTGRKALLSKDASGNVPGQFTAWVRDSRVEFRIEGPSQAVTLSTQAGSVRPGREYHVAVTFGPQGLRLYLNGQLQASRDEFTTGIAANDRSLAIGANTGARTARKPTAAADFFDGAIRDVNVYNRPLLRAEVAAVADIVSSGPSQGTTGTGLDRLVDIIHADPGLYWKISAEDIAAGAGAADAMNHIIVEAIWEAGVFNDGQISTADVRDLHRYIGEHYPQPWTDLHGDDEPEAETGFHRVQDDGATTWLFGRENAVNTVADGIYHLGFDIVCDRILNEDGNKNASVETVAFWLDQLLEGDRQNPALVNPAVDAYAHPTTGTGLDALVEMIAADPGLTLKLATSEITSAARAADRMNQILIDAIHATSAADDGRISVDDVRAMNAYILANHRDEWALLHGDDEEGLETGFHLVQNDGASTRVFAANAVNTVADGIFHMGFDIVGGQFLNEDGNKNVCVDAVADWLSALLRRGP